MGKKRKSRSSSGLSVSRPGVRKETSRFDPDEEFTDSTDEFHAGRDLILLDEGPDTKRRRKLIEDEEFLQPSDEEVYACPSVSDDEYSCSDSADEEDDGNDTAQKKSPRSRHRKAVSPALLEDAKAYPEEEEEEEEEIGGWGLSRKDYYDADRIETEGDALEEEAEAKKIQQKKLQSMNEADFGFDADEWATPIQAASTRKIQDGNVVTESLPELEISADMTADSRLKILKQRHPEFEPLSKDFIHLQVLYRELSEVIKQTHMSIDDSCSISLLKWRSLSAYLGAISMYFVLLTSPGEDSKKLSLALSPAQLRDHPIMDILISCRKQWEYVQSILEPKQDSVNSQTSKQDTDEPTLNSNNLKRLTEKLATKTGEKKVETASEQAKKASQLRRAERIRQTEAGLEELSQILESRVSRNLTPKGDRSYAGNDSEFGDETTLTPHEAAEKAKKKRSLRFYTSQIAQKANKRGAAGRDAGGDTDLPYRERLKDRQARLNMDAEKRGRQQANELERLGGESDEDDYRAAKEIRGGGASDSDDYYDFVASRGKEKKEDKRIRAEAYAKATREGGHVEVQEEIGADGKRAITYAIEKNKGLAPKRNKDVRNPRVKKRKKFEEKKKKLGSIRAVYKGGEGRGGYGGELTGIKKNLIKSVKL
ncbi:something about silencing protein 10 [Ophidiomyces ophidiicola]|nr:something about silencing protein 10 [Ophidiomyces ophidiicola]KAI1922386.1 something about silencing protein 10 [Ophidiomyces ophidiicola]KAI1958005.1 something about silencing protein 10 [Ophidiomyces ophidiicola]KAI2033260.1 something about silencing protein 10 [Ophidiomyces ophidiicola]KAI2094671.1 something about silencing protein 10 [Ophidiomyces ophidiicola]